MYRHSSTMLKPSGRRLATATAAILGVASLAGSLTASAQTPAPAQPAPAVTQPAPAVTMTPPSHQYHHPMAAKTAHAHRETLEDRIRTLHADLSITPAEETAWVPVAQAMRDNDANMQKMIAARRGEAAHEQTAVEALRTYERFSQAHVDGLKTLISSFETLYGAMPASQQAVADQVFKQFGRHDRPMKS